MRWLKQALTVGLLLGAGAVAVATAFSSHSDDYGKVGLPPGGVVHLPKGTVTVYQPEGVAGVGFQVVPLAGGDPIPAKSAGGTISADGVQRSDVVGEQGAVAKLDVPGDGDYRVLATSDVPVASTSLEFGTNTATAMAGKWKLLAGLVLAAFLIALIPTRRPRRRPEDDSGAPRGWSSNPRAPYAG